MAEKSTGKKNFFVKFFKGLKAEMKKISWPSWEKVLKQTVAVVLISAILCGFIRLFDVLAQYLVGAVGSIF